MSFIYFPGVPTFQKINYTKIQQWIRSFNACQILVRPLRLEITLDD